MSGQNEDPELTELATSLRALQPRPESLDHSVLMYRAGQASARGGLWPVATMLSLAIALALGIIAGTRSEPAVVERTVYVPAPDTLSPARSDEDVQSPAFSSSATAAGAWSRYAHLKVQVLEQELDGLPAPPDTPEPSPNLEELSHSL